MRGLSFKDALYKYFELKERNTTAKVEIIAGITTFLSMAYILFVNPSILTDGFTIALHQALGIPMTQPIPQEYMPLVYNVKLGFTLATALSAATATLIMSLYAKMPFGLAPGMGENAFIGYTAIPLFASILITSHDLQGVAPAIFAIYLALVSVFFNGILFLIFSVGRIREFILNSVPESIRLGISIGIGLFITLIGFSNIGIVEPGVGTPISFNTAALKTAAFYLGLLSFFIAAVLMAKKVIGGFIIAILGSTAIAILLSITGLTPGLISTSSSLFTMPSFTTSILNDLPKSFYLYFTLFGLGFPIAFSLFLVDFFDGIGTLTGLAMKAGLVKDGKVMNINKALISDALASIISPFYGTSTTVVYVESASGIEAGGKSGLTSLIIAILFFISAIFAPLLTYIPTFTTGGALVLVGLLFLGLAGKLTSMEDLTEVIPAFFTLVAIPFTYSITTGIGFGFISYIVIKIASGKFKDVKPGIVLIALLFIIYFWLAARGF
ncbi:MAG: NCS2 family permease [Fervidicoccus fontis]|uniref:NCS2 family permease n=1 Tax=Fervidicoccus fontis TaxID=683846 RepID=A0A2J6N949_9CREN|nr:MAG: NCS2 family permease [Fervidicoccus fontis]PMB77882.1 MAG: NCS2 family permease [Fervidicoccus fontis]